MSVHQSVWQRGVIIKYSFDKMLTDRNPSLAESYLPTYAQFYKPSD